jgi:hypothetical protein
MRVLFQLTFNNGLGNLYCGLVELLDFAHKYKDLGCDCELIFASNGVENGNKYIEECNFEDIFDMEGMEVFNKITNLHTSIKDKIYNGYTYHSSQYGPITPGIHWWDVFFDVIPTIIFPKQQYNLETLIYNGNKPKYLPKFIKSIYQNVGNIKEKFQDIKDVIQIRYNDYNLQTNDELKILSQRIREGLLKSEKKFYFMSNNQFFIDSVKELSNVTTFEFSNLSKLPNDHSYYFYNKQVNKNILMERLYENITEMVLLSTFNNIFYFTSFPWISTFLYYAKSKNPSINLINIKTDFNLS